jgi:hypothetical protein
MITYEKFKDIIVKYINFYKCEDQLRKMNIEVFESPLFETTGYYFDWLWEAYFTEDGCDTISWWAFEYHNLEEDFDSNGNYIGEKMEPGMWDKDENVIPMVTIEDLWNEVKDERREFVKTPNEQLKDAITDMVKLHIQNAVEPANIDTIKEAVGDMWDKIAEFFDDTDKLVCIDNTDEALADIMATYLEDKKPYFEAETESCYVEIFLDTNVGTLLVLSANDFELYVWQG